MPNIIMNTLLYSSIPPWWVLIPANPYIGSVDDYETAILTATVASLICGLSILLYRAYEKKKEYLRAHSEAPAPQPKQNGCTAVVAERERIARELHDDLGGILTSMRINAELLELGKANAEEAPTRIIELTKELYQQLNTVIWCLDDQNDTVSGLSAYVVKYARNFLEPADIRVAVNPGDHTQDAALSGNKRKEAFLIVKELLHNVLKHSRARNVSVGISCQDEQLLVFVEDDGVGFKIKTSEELPQTHRGIRNIRKQIRKLNGNISWQSAPGTRVSFTLPITE